MGGGPAGSTCAISLLQENSDLRVAIFDKQSFPRDKACGDGLSPGVVEILDSLGIDFREIPSHNVLRKAEIFGLGRIQYTADLDSGVFDLKEGITSRRYDFDNFLLKYANKQGAQVFEGTRFLDHNVDSGMVTAKFIDESGKNEFVVKCCVLVGADGANSRVRKSSNIASAPTRKTGIAIRGYIDVPGEWKDKVIFCYTENIKPGYGWVFPLYDGVANVGVGMSIENYRKQSQTLENLLDDFLESLNEYGLSYAQPENCKTYTLPSGVLKNFISDRVALIGDAAAMINPLSGEGIAYGMDAGRILAKLLSFGLKKSDQVPQLLSNYQRQYLAEYSRHFLSCHIAAKTLGNAYLNRITLKAASRDSNVQNFISTLMFGKGTITVSVIPKILLKGMG